MEPKIEKNRWNDYFMRQGEDFVSFWKEYLSVGRKKILVILGVGFDPRTTTAFRKIFNSPFDGDIDVIILEYFKNDLREIERYEKSVRTNKKDLDEYLKFLKPKNKTFIDIILRSADNRNIASNNALKIIKNFDQIANYNDIIIDISAIPPGVYFPLINKLLILLDRYANNKINLHIVGTENSYIDKLIEDEGLDENASYIRSFGGLDLERNKDLPKIWIPILGENKKEQIRILNKFAAYDEIYPLLPFPSYDIRRGDTLITFYDKTLNIEDTNIIYADEQNPFQVYRILRDTMDRYQKSFALIKGCKIHISLLASKLLSIGALLAAYENRQSATHVNVGIVHLEPHGYIINNGEDEILKYMSHNQFFELWLTGEPYES